LLYGHPNPSVALSGFSNAVWLYIIFALLLGAAITTSGLMYRVSLHLLRTLLPLFESLNIDPWILIFIVLLSADPFFVSYQSEVYLAAYYTSNEKGFTHAQGRKMAFLYCSVVIIIIFASIPFWRMIGLLG